MGTLETRRSSGSPAQNAGGDTRGNLPGIEFQPRFCTLYLTMDGVTCALDQSFSIRLCLRQNLSAFRHSLGAHLILSAVAFHPGVLDRGLILAKQLRLVLDLLSREFHHACGQALPLRLHAPERLKEEFVENQHEQQKYQDRLN